MAQATDDPFMNHLADLAIARKRNLGAHAFLAHDPLWRSAMAHCFGSPEEHDETIAHSAPKARGILKEPTQPRDVISATKGIR